MMKTIQLTKIQEEKVKTAIDSLYKNHRAILCWGKGCGKSYAALYIAQFLNMFPVIICPAQLCRQWYSLLKEYHIAGQVYSIEKLRRFDDWFRPPLCHLPFNALYIIDEAHIYEGRSVQNRFFTDLHRTVEFILLLSATIGQEVWRLEHIYECLRIMTPLNYVMRKNGMFYDEWNRVWRCWGDESRIVEKACKYIFPEYGSVMHPEEMEGFPKTKIRIEITQIDNSYKKNGVHIMGVLKNAELGKVYKECEFAKRCIDAGHSVAMFFNFRESIDLARKLLNCDNFIDGRVSHLQRNYLIERFNKDIINCLILGNKAGGVGLSLHGFQGGRKRYAIINPSFEAVRTDQSAGRVHRLFGADNVIVYVFADDTIEAAVAKRLLNKYKNLAAASFKEIEADIVKGFKRIYK